MKQKTLQEQEQLNIEKYVLSSDLVFEKNESGIYYSIKNEGSGKHLKEGEIVTFDYIGTTLNFTGKTFSGYEFANIQNYSFTIGDKNIIEGWNIAAKLFTEGTRGTIIVPYNLAYGGRSIENIPEYSTLIFEFRIRSTEVAVETETDFFEYIDNLDSISNFTENSVYYVSIFEGIGNDVIQGNLYNVEYTLTDLLGNTLEIVEFASINVGSLSVNQGFDAGITFFKEGGMGSLIIPYNEAFGTNQNGNILPYTNLVYNVRVLSDDLQVMEHSNLHKYLYDLGKSELVPNDSGFYYIQQTAGGAVKCAEGDTVIINYSGFLIPSNQQFDSCDTCEFILNSQVLPQGVNQGLKLMGEGTKATLILPSVLGFGAIQHGIIPPYSNLIYNIEILDIKN